MAATSDDPWNPHRTGSAGRRRSTPTAPPPRVGLIDSPEPSNIEAVDRSRRKYDRIPGPFDGQRIGLLETPVRLYDLSMGGCFVNSLHEQKEGTAIGLKIDLPYEGWIEVKAKTVYRRLGFGFAVRFIDMNAETEARLERSIRALQNRRSSDA